MKKQTIAEIFKRDAITCKKAVTEFENLRIPEHTNRLSDLKNRSEKKDWMEQTLGILKVNG